MTDKTNCGAHKRRAGTLDLYAARDDLLNCCEADIQLLQQQFPQQISPLMNAEVEHFTYPVLQYPKKVSSFNFDKDPDVAGMLMGIKGQYLLDTGVINIRKFIILSGRAANGVTMSSQVSPNTIYLKDLHAAFRVLNT